MSDDPNKNLSDAEANALRAMAGECAPSPELEGRVGAELKTRGAIRVTGGWIMKLSKTAAAAIIVGAAFAGGFLVGNRGETAPQPTDVATTTPSNMNEYMLLMFMRVDPSQASTAQSDASAEEPAPSDAYRAIIEEYRQWTIDRANEGRLVSAEKLADDTRVMTRSAGEIVVATDTHSDRALGGYFLITAPSLDDAIALARTHPHLKYGGEVEVRPIENTR